jgi:hypothetical protein
MTIDSSTRLSSSPASTATERDRVIGRFAWVSAWCALVLGQLHALARHRTADGKGDLDLPLTRAWAEPAGDFFSPLLTWGDPDFVYVTYGKVWLPIFLAFTTCAFVCYRRRAPRRFEKWVWRVTLFSYAGACGSVAAEYWTQWGNQTDQTFETIFLVTIPFVLLTVLSSTVLGVTLVVKKFRPRTAAVLLALVLPGAFVITEVTSLGNITLPIAFAFGILGLRMARGGPAARM